MSKRHPIEARRREVQKELTSAIKRADKLEDKIFRLKAELRELRRQEEEQ